MDLDNLELLNDWDKWKKTLSKAVDLGEGVGLSQHSIDKVAYKVGNFLSSSVDPESREQRVLKELWSVGDEEDRKALAKLMVKLVE